MIWILVFNKNILEINLNKKNNSNLRNGLMKKSRFTLKVDKIIIENKQKKYQGNELKFSIKNPLKKNP